MAANLVSAKVFDKEEKISRTNLVEIMRNAKEAVFSVKYRKKIDEAYVKEVLEGVNKAQLKDATKLK